MVSFGILKNIMRPPVNRSPQDEESPGQRIAHILRNDPLNSLSHNYVNDTLFFVKKQLFHGSAPGRPKMGQPAPENPYWMVFPGFVPGVPKWDSVRKTGKPLPERFFPEAISPGVPE
jgi:hypothetical protein